MLPHKDAVAAFRKWCILIQLPKTASGHSAFVLHGRRMQRVKLRQIMKHLFQTIAVAVSLALSAFVASAQTYYVAGNIINGWGGPQGSLMTGGPTIYSNVIAGTAGTFQNLKGDVSRLVLRAEYRPHCVSV